MSKKKRFNRPSESVFFESVLNKVVNSPAKTINRIRYFLGDCWEVGYNLRHKRPLRYGVFPEWLRKRLNIWKVK